MMGRLCIFCTVLFLLCSISFFASGQINTWRKAMNNARVGNHEKIWYADSLMLQYRKSNTDSAIFFARQIIRLAKLEKDTSSIDFATINLGSFQRQKGNLDSALHYYFVVLNSYKAQKFDEGIASVYNNLATVYKTQSRYDLAIKNYHEALELLKKSKRYNAKANLYSNFAGLYFKLENYDKALELWLLARTYYPKDTSLDYQITHAYRGIARIYMQKLELGKALQSIQTALKLDKKNQVDVFIAEDLLILIQIYAKENDVHKIAQILNQLKKYIANSDVVMTKAAYYEFSGDYELSQKNSALALKLYDSSLFYLQGEDAPENKLQVLQKKMAVRLKSENKYQLSDELEAIYRLEKVVAKARQDRITQETDARYSLRDKQQLIQALNEKNKTAQQLVVKERELQRKTKQQLIFMWIAIGLFGLFFIYLLFINKRLRITKVSLEKNIDQKDFLFKELNHRVKNNLHIVNSFLGIEMHGKTNEVQEILKTCENRIHSLGLVHEMLYQGELVENVNIADYFQKLISNVTESFSDKNIDITMKSTDTIVVTASQSVLLGLIVNELITNAVKHARKPNEKLSIDVCLVKNEDVVTIEVIDNGKGFPKDFDPQKSTSMGIRLAFGLAKQLNASLTYHVLENGTMFILSGKF